MLSITPRSNAGDAKRYYLQEYAAEQIATPEWGGRGAELLGLAGAVKAADFERLVDNRHPVSNEKLCPRESKDRRVLYDATFAPPKSVTLALELGNDPRILQAFHNSVRNTMKEVETLAAVRTRVADKVCDQTTANCTWAMFTHSLARPVDGKPSPLLHAHVCVMPHTFDPQKQRHLALQIGGMKSQAPEMEKLFHQNLRQEVRRLGYDTRRKGKSGWELCGVPDSAIKKFSERKSLIERMAEGLGARRKQRVAKVTREPKRHDLDKESLHAEWVSRLTSRELRCFERLVPSTREEKRGNRFLDRAREMMQRVYVTEREAVER